MSLATVTVLWPISLIIVKIVGPGPSPAAGADQSASKP